MRHSFTSSKEASGTVADCSNHGSDFFDTDALGKDLIQMWSESRLMSESTDVYDTSGQFTPSASEVKRLRETVQAKKEYHQVQKE